jgi:uncharacterized protein YkwD
VKNYPALGNKRRNRKLKLSLLTVVVLGALLQGCTPMGSSSPIKNQSTASPNSISMRSENGSVQHPSATKIPTPSAANKPILIEGITIGQDEKAVISKLGEPARKEASEQDFTWYIFNNKDYVHYLQVGIQDGHVVALYTSTGNWTSTLGVNPNSTKDQVTQAHQNDQNVRSGKESASYTTAGMRVTYFFDTFNENKIQGIQMLDQSIVTYGSKRPGGSNPLSESVRTSFERQIFDLSNAARVKEGKKPFEWSDAAALSSRKHSQDMADKGYFDHDNKDGKTPFDRMEAAGINYSYAAENIAAGQSNAIEVVNGWLNSAGHRKNIFGNAQMLGVGVAFGGPMNVYYTQNFYTPR